MNTPMGTNSGVSLNFDAQALHNQEEAEFEREEQLRERELREILTKAFDDDLTDEEEGSAESTGATSNDESDHPDHLHHGGEPEPVEWGTPGAHLYGSPQPTSTPLTGGAAPLSTPASTPYHQAPPGGVPLPYLGGEPQYQYPTHEQEWDVHHHPNLHQHHPQHQTEYYPQGVGAYGLREEAEGGSDGPVQNVYDTGQQHPQQHLILQQQQLQQQQQLHHQYYPTPQPLHPDPGTHQPQQDAGRPYGVPDGGGYYPGAGDYLSTALSPMHQQHQQQHQQQPSDEPPPAPPTQDYTRHYRPYAGGGEAQGSPGRIGASVGAEQNEGQGDFDGYKVKYFGGGSDKPEQDVRGSTLDLQADQGKDLNALQRDFLNHGGATDSRQLGQLQILYNARGQKIEELTQEVQALREDSDREIRILKHKLALTQDERDGLEQSLKQSQTLLTDSRRQEAERQGKVNALETQIGALQQSKEELMKKVQTGESNIEALNEQLCALESSESLARSRDQHENIVSGLQHKYESEIFDLKQRLDKSASENEAKSEEIETLKKKVNSLVKATEDAHIERADTINRLSRSLEDSQKQCQQMLEAGTGQELSRIKVQLQEVIAGKSIAEDMSTALADELQDLKEQVMMYESASQYGILLAGGTSSVSQTPRPGGATTSVSADDSYIQLGIKGRAEAEDSGSGESTPRAGQDGTSRDGTSLNTEQTLHGLKKELERCLAMYRTKRQQVGTLQEELRGTRAALDDVTTKLETSRKEMEESARRLAEYEAEVGPLGGAGPGQESVQERRLQRQVDSLTRDKRMLDEEVKELMARIDEIADSEEQAKEANRELSHQMADMVREYDEDKRQALEHCESTIMQHHERVKAQLEADLKDEFTQDKDSITRQYEQQIAELRQELDSTQSELDEVKDMYISVCQAKDHIRESTDNIWTEKMEAQLAEIRSALTKEKEVEIETLKGTWAANNDVTLSSAKEKWLKEQEEHFNKRIEDQVAASKADWLKEHGAAKDTAVKAALVSAEQAWKEKWDLELQHTLTEKLKEAQESWSQSKDAVVVAEVSCHLQSAPPALSGEHQGVTETEVARRLEEARQAWISTDLPKAVEQERTAMEAGFQRHLEEAKETWRQTELREAVKEANMMAAQMASPHDVKSQVADMLSEAKALWLEEERQQVDTTVGEVRQAAQEETKRKVEAATAELQQEIAELYSAKLHLEKELSALHTKTSEERAELLTAKDTERREALLAAQDQCERDYREFLNEHQDTLNKALRTAREEFAREKTAIEQKHEAEIQGLREREVKASQLERHVAKESAYSEQKWQEKIDEMNKKHSEEKDTIMRTHRDNLLKALEEARSRWQQKYEEALEENSLGLLEEKEAAWSDERSSLQAQIDDANARAAQFQDSLATFKADMEEAHRRELAQLKSTHQGELAASTVELRKQLDGRSAEMERLSGEVQACVAGLEEAQRVAHEEAQELRAAISQRDADIARLKAELTASSELVENCESINVDVVRKLEGMQKEADKLERERKEVEGQKEQLTATFRSQYGELLEQLQRSERNLKTTDVHTQKQIALVQESMERESAVAMEKMKAKMVELRSSHLVTIDNLRKQQLAEKKEWKQQMDEHKRDSAHTPTQTDGNTVDGHVLSDMGKQYMKTVTRMRSEVLRHVNDSNTRAAETVREQIIKERHQTARRLRRYYMKCLNHLLDAECQQMTREEKLAYMEQAMEYIPSRDTSQMTSASSGGHSAVTSPDDFTTTTTPALTTSAGTSANNTPKSNSTSRSRIEYHSPSRGREKDPRVKDVVDSNLQTRVKALVDSFTPELQAARREDGYSRGEEDMERQRTSRSKHRRPGAASELGSQSLDRHLPHKRPSKAEIPRLDLSQVHGGMDIGHSPPQQSRANGTHHVQGGRQYRTAYHSHSSWDSEASSGDNTHHNGHYRAPESGSKGNRSGSRSHQRSQANRDSSSNVNTPSRNKYTLSSKSAEHFSIEKPRGTKSKRIYTDISYEMDIETPSVSKSQSTTCLEHSTPRGQYLLDSEPRKYYDVDFRTFGDSALQPVRDAACGGSTPLTKVNSETYLLTPVGLHGSISMGDVRDIDEGDQSLTDSKHMCRSDEGLLNYDPETPGRSYVANQSSQNAGPQKSMSMPNVARAENWVNNMRMKSYPENYSNHAGQLANNDDSGESTLSESVNQTPYVSVRPKQKSSSSGSKVYNGKQYTHFYGSEVNGKKEQYHVAFKNVETNCEDDGSDNESVKSFLSTSSVSDFRHALKTKQSQATRTAASRDAATQQGSGNSNKKPLKVMPPSEQLQSMLAQVPDNVHRPVAMVTRHTQVPSPRPVYKQPRTYSK